jgi:mannose-6-phosphate isomerase-like protein (cupin superfamily)
MHVLRAADRPPSSSRTVRFEGGDYGTAISFFAVDNEPGQGPGLHVHPYPETWFVHAGKARIEAGTEVVEAGPGDIVVVPGGVPHKFTNTGEGQLVIFCVHDTAQMVQTDL